MMKMTTIERKRLTKLRTQLLREAENIVLDGGKLAPFDPLMIRIAKISRLLLAK